VLSDQENGETAVNGDIASDAGDGGQMAPKKQDIIIITGKKENCEAARDALLVSVYCKPINYILIDIFCFCTYYGMTGECQCYIVLSLYSKYVNLPVSGAYN